MSGQKLGHTETGVRFKVSSERPEKRELDLVTPRLVVQRVIHFTTAAPMRTVIVDLNCFADFGWQNLNYQTKFKIGRK